MKILLIFSGGFLVGYLLGDFNGFMDGLMVAESIQWEN